MYDKCMAWTGFVGKCTVMYTHMPGTDLSFHIQPYRRGDLLESPPDCDFKREFFKVNDINWKGAKVSILTYTQQLAETNSSLIHITYTISIQKVAGYI